MTESQLNPANAVLAANDIRKSFRVGDRQIEVLHGAQLELHPRERLCLMGQSGAGKSTLLHVLGLLEPPTEGEVTLLGQEVWKLPMKARAALRNRHIGFVFQAYHLLPDLTALENITLPARIAHSYGTVPFDKKKHTAEALEMLESFGLKDRIKHRPNQLSGGERQRVAIARALILGPQIVIADEPTGNLDTGTGELVLELLFAEQERRGAALLLVTHDERLAERCDRVLVMEDGQMQADSSVVIPHQPAQPGLARTGQDWSIAPEHCAQPSSRSFMRFAELARSRTWRLTQRSQTRCPVSSKLFSPFSSRRRQPLPLLARPPSAM